MLQIKFSVFWARNVFTQILYSSHNAEVQKYWGWRKRANLCSVNHLSSPTPQRNSAYISH